MPPTSLSDSTPITRIIGAEELRLLTVCDDLWHVRADVTRSDPHIAPQAT